MQTFLPFASFEDSANALDNKRLGKQRVEGLQILNVITGLDTTPRMVNHPTVMMWQGHQAALCDYIMQICKVWTSRGFYDNVADKIRLYHIDLFAAWEKYDAYKDHLPYLKINMPAWINCELVHQNHRSRLMQKDPTWYGKYQWDDVDAPGNFWPVTNHGNNVYMKDGKVISMVHPGSPMLTSLVEGEYAQCTYCNYWTSFDFMRNGECEICQSLIQERTQYNEIRSFSETSLEASEAAHELLKSIKAMIALYRLGFIPSNLL